MPTGLRILVSAQARCLVQQCHSGSQRLKKVYIVCLAVAPVVNRRIADQESPDGENPFHRAASTLKYRAVPDPNSKTPTSLGWKIGVWEIVQKA
jgi:hypothetical protein